MMLSKQQRDVEQQFIDSLNTLKAAEDMELNDAVWLECL
jgi:hypothetical protein